MTDVLFWYCFLSAFLAPFLGAFFSLTGPAMPFELQCVKLGESDRAYKIYDEDSNLTHWIPFSQLDETHFDKNGHGCVIMSDWLARKLGYLK